MSLLTQSVLQHQAQTEKETCLDISWLTIYCNLISTTVQTAIGYMFVDIVIAISLHYISDNLGLISTAGFAFCMNITNGIIIPIGAGLNQSLNLHSSQAQGAGKLKLSVQYLVSTIYLHFIFFIPLVIIIYCTKNLLALLIQESERQETIEMTFNYLPYYIASIFLEIQYEGLKAYLLSYKYTLPFTLIQLFTLILHIFWCQLLIPNYGYVGAGLSVLITEFLNLVFIIIWLFIKKGSDKDYFTYFSLLPSSINCKLITSYLKSSVPIIIHIFLEYFAFFYLSFVAMTLGTIQMNAQIAITNGTGLFFRFPISLSLALMSYLGYEMGRYNIKIAKRYSIAGAIIILIFAALVSLLMIILLKQWAEFYSTDTQVHELLYEVAPILIGGFIILDQFQAVISGILKGMNKSSLVSYYTLFTYYVLGCPIVLILAESWGLNLGLRGIWIGFGTSNFIILVSFWIVLFKSSWEKQSEEIRNRVENQNKLQFDSLIEVT